MALTKQDKKELIEFFENRNQTNNMLDMAFKFISTLSIALIVWIFSTVNDVQKDVEVMKANNEWTAEMLSEFRKFTDKPRFTQEDFQKAVTPIINNINQNTLQLNENLDYQKEVENRLIKLEIRNGIK